MDAEWHEALNAEPTEPDPRNRRLGELESGLDSLRASDQMLGKIAEPERNLMALQLGESVEGAWDARSFATAIVVPWSHDNQQVIGNSSDPYVSNPLRRPLMDMGISKLRDKTAWGELVAFLAPLEDASLVDLQSAFRRVLKGLAGRLARQAFRYPIPQRISQPQLERIVHTFLSVPSGGLRPLAISAALFRTLGEGFSLFSEVRSQGINEADSASGMPGDIMCYDDTAQIVLAIEVKDANLTLAHVQGASLKAKQASEGLSSFLFAVPATQQSASAEIEEITQRDWASGLNIYTATIPMLIGTVFVLLKEEWRVQFLKEVGCELDERLNQPARRAWHDLLIQEDS